MVRIVFVSLLPLFSGGIAACSTAHAEHGVAPSSISIVSTAVVRRTSLDVLARVSGTVRGRNTATLTSKTTGYVREVKVHAGDRVNAGDVLAVLEANDVEASVRRARAALAEANDARAESDGALDAAKAAARVSTASHDRAIALLATGAITKQEADEIEARWHAALAQEEMARSRIRAASARIDEAKAQLAESQATLDYAKITAPFSGRVLERRVDPGSLASPGMPLLVVEQEGKLRVEAAVDESHASSIALGDVATIELDTPLQGIVGEIVPSVDVASRAFLVKIDLPTEVVGLRAGMFVRVGFRVGQRTPMVVPTIAIAASGALDRIFVVEGDRARMRIVTLGETRGATTEILSGLDVGETIVATASNALRDGDEVKVAP